MPLVKSRTIFPQCRELILQGGMGPILLLQCPWGTEPPIPGPVGLAQQSPRISMLLWPPVVTWAMDINTDSYYCRTVKSDMVLDSSLGPDITMAPGDSAWLSDGTTALRHQHDHNLQPRLQTSIWSLVATWVTDINTDPCVVISYM